MTDKRMFLAGLTAGALGGLLVVRHRTRPRRMPHLDISQKVLAETRGEDRAAMLAGRVQARYDELVAGQPHFDQPALRKHLEASILPGLALYRTLLEENDDREAVLAEMDRLFTAWVEHSDRRKQMRLAARLPGRFALLRIANRVALKKGFPPEGWRIEWLEENDRCIAYNIHECFYLKVLTAYGAAELTPHFCQGDDLLYGGVPGIAWERTKTLGRGDDLCNFRFRRQLHRTDTVNAFATPGTDVLAMYICPACKGALESVENVLRCPACGVSYPLVDGVPDFLLTDPEQAIGPLNRAMVRAIVRLYETPLWYVPILKLAGGKGAPSYGEVIRQMVGLMDVREGLLLDVACGPGTWGRRLASPSLIAYGIDISWSMLRQGAAAAAAAGAGSDDSGGCRSMHFAHARVEALPFPDRRFDAAYCGGALHGFPDPAGALAEIGRTLKPGAPLVVLTFLARDQPFVRMRRRAEARNDKLLKLHMFEVTELEHALAQAGFEGFEPHIYGGVIIFRARKGRASI